MEHKKTSVEDFLQLDGQIIDVRSPKEYQQGHIPGAWNLPLFTDVERAKVGIAYKLQGPTKAVEVGLKFVGPKLSEWVREIRKRKASYVKVYCARGGMRSQSLLWLLNFCRIPATSLLRGYKNYRSWVLKTFEQNYTFNCIGGNTGAGKSALLQELKPSQQVIDLEELANHRGSLFGSNSSAQPTTEQFENNLAQTLGTCDLKKPIWIEDESRLIGRCCIPNPIYDMMRAAPLYFLQVSRETRIENLIQEYGNEEPSKLTTAVERLKKRLGNRNTYQILEHIQDQNLQKATDLLLNYYDKAYVYTLRKRSGPLIPIEKDKLLNDPQLLF